MTTTREIHVAREMDLFERSDDARSRAPRGMIRVAREESAMKNRSAASLVLVLITTALQAQR
jgi:hypothetical protein